MDNAGCGTDILSSSTQVPVQRSKQEGHPRVPRPSRAARKILRPIGLHRADQGPDWARNPAHLLVPTAQPEECHRPVHGPARHGGPGDGPAGFAGPPQGGRVEAQGPEAVRRVLARPALRARARRDRGRDHRLDGRDAPAAGGVSGSCAVAFAFLIGGVSLKVVSMGWAWCGVLILF